MQQKFGLHQAFTNLTACTCVDFTYWNDSHFSCIATVTWKGVICISKIRDRAVKETSYCETENLDGSRDCFHYSARGQYVIWHAREVTITTALCTMIRRQTSHYVISDQRKARVLYWVPSTLKVILANSPHQSFLSLEMILL